MAPPSSSSKVTPRQQSRAPRSATTQPTYDFLAAEGGDEVLTSMGTGRTQQQQLAVRAVGGISRPDIANEDLRTQLRSLRYDVEALRQARDVARVQHERELRETRARAEAEFGRAQAAEHGKNIINNKYESLSRELKDVQEFAANEKHALEKTLRSLQQEKRSLEEDVDEARSEVASIERQCKHQLQSVDVNQAALRKTLEEARIELERKTTSLQASTIKQAEQEAESARLEEDLLRLKTHGGDVEELAIVRRELSEQVAHMRRLEKTNRDQGAELRHFRQTHKSVQIVEEEKRALEIQVQQIDDLQRELGEAQYQREILENERKSWAAYLSDLSTPEVEFESPEAIVKALVRERMEKASLLERLGAVQPQLSEKEAIILSLEKERTRLCTDLEKARTTGGGGDPRARSRIERQKALAIKEISYLREQLKTFESEETEELDGSGTEASRQRVQSLEALVEQYRAEIDTVSTELSTRDAQLPPMQPQSLKRAAPEDADERLGELSRKNRQLQSDLSVLHESASILRADLSATKAQLSSLQTSSKTRVLALRSNPTDDFHQLKYSTIATLRTENAALLAQLDNNSNNSNNSDKKDTKDTNITLCSPPALVPAASLAALRLELDERTKAVAEHALMLRRLKAIFGQKTTEFREAVASILGWRMEFTPSGKFRLTSIFHPGADDGDGSTTTTNGIIFDGEKGEMKFIGGPESDFALEVRGLVKFWVHERGEMPAFMAACQLEFYEKSTRALRM